MKKKQSRWEIISAAVIVVALLLIAELSQKRIVSELEYGEYVYSVISRTLGGVGCLILIWVCLPRKMLGISTKARALLAIVPCFAVAVNNFPFVTYFGGEAYINAEMKKIILYALMCLGVGFFEELAFRGCIFTAALQRLKGGKLKVFFAILISSAVFGFVHLLNLLGGAGLGGVALQVGYSALIGAMCSVVLIKTGSIWYCVILHAVYNFAGGVVPECGGGTLWSNGEILLTAVVAIAVAIYVITVFLRLMPEEIDALLSNKTTETKNGE